MKRYMILIIKLEYQIKKKKIVNANIMIMMS